MVNQFGIINLNDTYLLPGPLFSEATGYINSLELTDDERVILYWVKKCRPISFIQKQLNIDDKILGNFIQSLQDKQMLQQTRANAHQARSWHYSSFNQYIEDSENSNLRTLWGKAVQSFGNKAYILDRNDKTVYTYGEFDEIVKYVTSTLIQYKIGKGDKIILHADINFEAIALFWACMHLGVVFIPVNSSLAEAVMVGLIEKLDPKLVFLSHDAGFCKIWPDKTIFFDKEINLPNKLYFSIWLKDSLDIKDMPEINENDMAVILYTSGSTGAPKGVKLANGQLYSSALNMVKTYLWNEHDINLSTNDLDSIAGFRNACFATVAAGAACVIPNLAERALPSY